MPIHTAIWVGRQKNIAPKGLRGLYTVRAHHINVNFVTPTLFRSVKRMRKIAKLGRRRPSFCVLFAKKYSGLRKKSTSSPVVAVVTNMSYVDGWGGITYSI